jgi:hypothetical protein
VRQQLQAFRQPGDGADEQHVRAKIGSITDLICESVAGKRPDFVIMSDYYSVQASLALVGRWKYEALGLTKITLCPIRTPCTAAITPEAVPPYTQISVVKSAVDSAAKETATIE